MTTPGPIEVLYHRLERGWQLINQERDPIRRRRLEEHWIGLLRQYERACDAIAAAPNEAWSAA